MKRIGFSLRLRPGMGEKYDAAHRQVWPEMLALLKQCGVTHYSIFRRGEELFLVMEVEDFERTWSAIEKSPVNTAWQTAMAEYFEPKVGPLQPGERFAMFNEVFYLE